MKDSREGARNPAEGQKLRDKIKTQLTAAQDRPILTVGNSALKKVLLKNSQLYQEIPGESNHRVD